MTLWKRLFAKRGLEKEMEEEMRFHEEMQAAQNVAAGMPPREAAQAARRRFGHMDGIKERCRDQRGWLWLENILRDVRYALRVLARTPGHTTVAVLTLALGIGFATIQLGFTCAVLVKALPFERPERIMLVQLLPENLDLGGRLLFRDYLRWREVQKSLRGTAAYMEQSVDLSGPDMLASRYEGASLSAGVLKVLGVQPQLGRGFLPEDERPGAPCVVLLGHKIWQRDFGGDPRVIGRAVRWSGKPATIVGVMPPQFSFPYRGESWVNLRASTTADEQWVEVIGRLRDEVTPAAAQAENATVGREFTLPSIDIGRPLGAGRLLIQPYQDKQIPKHVRILLLTLLGVAGGVLALASMNVATLLFLRALARGHELALRLAIGGGRGRLVRQMLCESLVLAALGAAGGVLIAWLGVALLDRLIAMDSEAPYWIHIELDRTVLAATVLLTFLTGFAAGLLPALRATRLNLSGVLKDKSFGISSLRLGRLSRALTTVQAAVACALLLITGILARGLSEMGRLSLPFDTTRTLGASLDAAPYVGKGEALDRFRASLLERAGALPGVMAATLAAHHPFDNSNRVVIGLRDGSRGSGWAYREFVAANYMQALGVPFREGRGFTAADRDAVVINESLARRYWPGESPIGRQFRETDATQPRPWLTVIGVVADLPMQGVLRAESSAGYYAPLTSEWPWRVCLLLRSGAPPGALARPLRETIRELAPDLPVYDVSTVAEFADRRLAASRAMAGLGLTFAAGALFLAAIGVHGVTAFAAERRAREFSIRLALGARTAHIVVLVLRQALLQGGIALAAGLLLGHLLSRPLVAAMSRRAGAPGVEIYAGAAGVISLVLAAALWLPARRSLKVDPALTLRAD